RRETEAHAIKQAVLAILREIGHGPSDVRHAVSVDHKRGDRGLRTAFEEMDIPLLFMPEDRINSFRGPYDPSRAARRALGVRAVAEPCALLGGRRTRLVIAKRTFPRVTVAVAVEDAEPAMTSAGRERQWDL
ncbi:MAG TPA: cobalamin biosynthesis protein, partial [Spirochaetia bacterium]